MGGELILYHIAVAATQIRVLTPEVYSLNQSTSQPVHWLKPEAHMVELYGNSNKWRNQATIMQQFYNLLLLVGRPIERCFDIILGIL